MADLPDFKHQLNQGIEKYLTCKDKPRKDAVAHALTTALKDLRSAQEILAKVIAADYDALAADYQAYNEQCIAELIRIVFQVPPLR